MDYYSVRNAIICLVDDREIPDDGYTQDIQVRIVQASDFEDAFQQALKLGREEEHEYRNEDGRKVRWAFKEVEVITKIGHDVLGVEISSRMEGIHPKEPLDINTLFYPEASEPKFNDETDT